MNHGGRLQRSGGTILWCVASILAILALAGFWRSFSTAHLRLRGHDIELEWRFEALARSLLAGLEAQVRTLANQDTLLARTLRRPVAKTDPAWVDLMPSLDQAPALATLARDEYRGFVLEKLEAGLTRQVGLVGSLEEKVAVLVLRATVRLPSAGRRRAVRCLEQVRSIKVSRTTVDPELRRFGIFVGQADGLTDLAQANSMLEDLARRTVALHDAMVRARDASSGEPRREWELAIGACIDPKRQGAFPRKLPEFRQWAYYGLERRSADWFLENLDLASTLQEDRSRILELEARCEESIKTGHVAAARAARELAQALQKAIFRHWGFQSVLRLLPMDGSAPALVATALATRL
ncbi:MAG: hypothetical protein HY815_00005, partial [Candidatus Riflebacteria bacterium]|nr:hypothetical protein [Candidatus Riflebacteria bacterium]